MARWISAMVVVAGGCANVDPDVDGDGLPDTWEVTLRTDPFDADSDRDGRDDAADLLFGDPNVADHDGADVPDVYVWRVVRQPNGVELSGLVTSSEDLGSHSDPDDAPDCVWVDAAGHATWTDEASATFVHWNRRFDAQPAVMAWLESWVWYQSDDGFEVERLTSNNYILQGGEVPVIAR